MVFPTREACEAAAADWRSLQAARQHREPNGLSATPPLCEGRPADQMCGRCESPCSALLMRLASTLRRIESADDR